MKFDLISKKTDRIRVGQIETAHGIIHTPFFMPVATVGSVKGISPQELKKIDAEIILSNTYHLYLRPGEKQIKKMGGLHNFMKWSSPILTDSGGYQVFSLAKNQIKNQKPVPSISEGSKIKKNVIKSLVRVTEDGVEFTSHLDGSKHLFTPEKVIDIQLALGVDIMMPLDVCPSGKATTDEIKEAVRLTIAWAKRSKSHFNKKLKSKSLPKGDLPLGNYKLMPGLFGIVQGGLNQELRKYCATELIKLDFDGYSIGGLAVDHETREMWDTVKQMGEILPKDKPRYLMGVGTPDDIIRAIHLGVDMFDCVLPTRLARHGAVFVYKNKNPKSQILNSLQEKVSKIQPESKNDSIKEENNQFELINLLNSKYRSDGGVIEEGCECQACSGGFSRAYISHLIRSNEMLGLRLATLHNLHLYLNLVKLLRFKT